MIHVSSYGDVYPMSQLARFIAMLASPLSIMILSVPLSSIYSKYTTICEIYQIQLAIPENIHYLTYDNTSIVGKLPQQEIIDVTEQINETLQHLGISQQLEEELNRRKNKFQND